MTDIFSCTTSSVSPEHASTAIDYAIRASLRSPCAKSKRGVAIITTFGVLGDQRLITAACNGPPPPAMCGEGCTARCRERTVHAEARAMVAHLRSMARIDTPCARTSLFHVKTVGGEPVKSGKPSCTQCATLMADQRWLDDIQLWTSGGWRSWRPQAFYLATLENT